MAGCPGAGSCPHAGVCWGAVAWQRCPSSTALGFGWGFPWEIHLREAYQADFVTPSMCCQPPPPPVIHLDSRITAAQEAASTGYRRSVPEASCPDSPAPSNTGFCSASWLPRHRNSRRLGCFFTVLLAAGRQLPRLRPIPLLLRFPLRMWHTEQGKSPPAPWRRAWCGEGSRCCMWWESFLNPCGGGG